MTYTRKDMARAWAKGYAYASGCSLQFTQTSTAVRTANPYANCCECGRPVSGDEFDASGICQLCLNGPLPDRGPND